MIENSHDSYELFSLIRHKSTTASMFEKKLLNIINNYESINNIKYLGKNLIFYACLYENEEVFEYLANNYYQDFQQDFEHCISFIYTNKSPLILKICTEHLNNISDEFKKEILTRISHNCFRNENIQILSNWVQKSFSPEEINRFICLLVQNKNKPFLQEVSFNEQWHKQLIQTFPLIQEEIKKFNLEHFFQRLIKNKEFKILNTETIEHAVQPSVEIVAENNNKNIISKTVILRKKRKVPSVG